MALSRAGAETSRGGDPRGVSQPMQTTRGRSRAPAGCWRRGPQPGSQPPRTLRRRSRSSCRAASSVARRFSASLARFLRSFSFASLSASRCFSLASRSAILCCFSCSYTQASIHASGGPLPYAPRARAGACLNHFPQSASSPPVFPPLQRHSLLTCYVRICQKCLRPVDCVCTCRS